MHGGFVHAGGESSGKLVQLCKLAGGAANQANETNQANQANQALRAHGSGLMNRGSCSRLSSSQIPS